MGRHGENIRKRKDGRWEARCIIGYDENGKARYKYLYGKTYNEVRDLKNRMTAQRIAKSSSVTGNMKITFNQLAGDWLISIKPDIKESTYSKYVFLLNKHILPELGKILLINISSETIDRFTFGKIKAGKLNGTGGLSPKTVSDILSVIKLILNFGCQRNYYCLNNIIIKNPRQNKPEIMILSVTEQQLLEHYLLSNPEQIHIGILLSLYTGLRIGEVCALKWEDINFNNGTVTIPLPSFLIRYIRPFSDCKSY